MSLSGPFFDISPLLEARIHQKVTRVAGKVDWSRCGHLNPETDLEADSKPKMRGYRGKEYFERFKSA